MSATTATLKSAISRDLDRLSEQGLGEVRAYVARLAKAANDGVPDRGSLAGIWEGKGFERLADLEGEIRSARDELTAAIGRRRL